VAPIAESGAPGCHRAFNQRVAVRVSYSANKNPGQWKAHGRYVAREVQRGAEKQPRQDSMPPSNA